MSNRLNQSEVLNHKPSLNPPSLRCSPWPRATSAAHSTAISDGEAISPRMGIHHLQYPLVN